MPRAYISELGEWAHPDDDTSIIGPCGSRSATRSRRGAYTVTLHTKRRVRKGAKVRVTVRRGSARSTITVRAGRSRVASIS